MLNLTTVIMLRTWDAAEKKDPGVGRCPGHISQAKNVMCQASSRLAFSLGLMAILSGLAKQSATHAEVAPPSESRAANPQLSEVIALVRRAAALAAANKSAEADEAYKAAVTAAEQEQGSQGLAVADVLLWQAMFYRDQRRYEEAWSAAERGLLIRQQKLPQYDTRTATMHGLVGSIALWQRQPSKAEAHFRAVLDAYNHRPTTDLEVIASSAAKELAVLLRNRSQYADAEVSIKQAIAIRELASPRDEQALAFDFEFLGLVHIDQGRFVEA